MNERPSTREARAEQLDEASERIDIVNEDYNAEYTEYEHERSMITIPKRKTRHIQYTIDCQLCDKHGKIATRYPGKIPTICDDCYYSYGTPESARSALKDKKNPEAAAERKKRYELKRKARRAAVKGDIE